MSPPWGSKYTININTEMNYWPAEPAKLAECVDPLISMVMDLTDTGARTARSQCTMRAAGLFDHNTDLWRASAPIDGAPTTACGPAASLVDARICGTTTSSAATKQFRRESYPAA